MKNTVFPHKFWRPFLDCMPRLFFRPQYVWFPVHLKGLLIPLWYETLVVNWQNWLFTLYHQSRSVLSPNPIAQLSWSCSGWTRQVLLEIWIEVATLATGHLADVFHVFIDNVSTETWELPWWQLYGLWRGRIYLHDDGQISLREHHGPRTGPKLT